VPHTSRRREVEGARHVRDDTHDLEGREEAEIAQDTIQRVRRDEILSQVRAAGGNACSNWRDQRWMRQISFDEMVKGPGEAGKPIGGNVVLDELHGDQAILVGVVGAKHGSPGARADLVQHAERSEGVKRGGSSRFRVQRDTPQGGWVIVASTRSPFNPVRDTEAPHARASGAIFLSA
jgi:hypothetical protein